MNRQAVYNLIDGERDYQDSKAERSIEADIEHSVSDWIIYLEYQLLQARCAIYSLNKDSALEHIRKIAALAVACMEVNETKPRVIHYGDGTRGD